MIEIQGIVANINIGEYMGIARTFAQIGIALLPPFLMARFSTQAIESVKDPIIQATMILHNAVHDSANFQDLTNLASQIRAEYRDDPKLMKELLDEIKATKNVYRANLAQSHAILPAGLKYMHNQS